MKQQSQKDFGISKLNLKNYDINLTSILFTYFSIFDQLSALHNNEGYPYCLII